MHHKGTIVGNGFATTFLKKLYMKLIESKTELLPWEPGIKGVYKAIERAGRTCYKSEDKITDDSAKGFVDRMIASKHTAMLEHGTVYLFIPRKINGGPSLASNQYSKNWKLPSGFCITTNLRVLLERNRMDLLHFICSPMEHRRRYTFKFTCDRGVSHELVRHRVFSFAQESTRYCNYSKDKFDNEVTFIIPSWLSGKVNECAYHTMAEDIAFLEQLDYNENLRIQTGWFTSAFIDSEACYLEAIKTGATPQEARAILPNATKTEIVMTGFASDWRYFFDLRLFGKTGAPHPDMKLLAEKARTEAEKNGIWEDIMRYPSKFE